MPTEWLKEPDLSVRGQSVFFGTSERIEAIPAKSINLTITSPPYWNLKDYGHPSQIGHESYPEYLERMNAVWSECSRISTDDAILCINVGNRRAQKRYYPIGWDIYKTMKEKDWVLLDNIIWYIPNAMTQPNHYIPHLFDNKYENVLVFAKNYDYKYTFNKPRVRQKYATADPRDNKNPDGRCIGNVIRIPAYRPPNIKDLGYYKAGYPEELVHLLMHAFSNPGDVVLDPFLGSGTTLKVAAATGRQGVGYEINGELKTLIGNRISEEWVPPPFETMDILHSATNQPGTNGRVRRTDVALRKKQMMSAPDEQLRLSESEA